MEQMYSVQSVASIMDCEVDTARLRMKEMPNCVNVGTERRRILLVPESDIEDWFRNHRLTPAKQIQPKQKARTTRIKPRADGKIARMDRRTGKLKVG